MKKNNTDPIEQLLSDIFDDYSVPEFKNSWAKIKAKVFKHQFLKFNLHQFNIYYSAVVAGAIITAGTVLINPYVPKKATDNSPETKTEIPNIAGEDAVLPEQAKEKEIHYDKLHDIPPYAVEDDENINDEPVNNEEQKEAIVNSSDNNKTDETGKDKDEIVRQEATGKDTALDSVADDVKYDKTDAGKVENLKPVVPNDSVEVLQTNSLIRDSSDQREVIKKIIVTEETVIKKDTVVKVIRKRRRKK